MRRRKSNVAKQIREDIQQRLSEPDALALSWDAYLELIEEITADLEGMTCGVQEDIRREKAKAGR